MKIEKFEDLEACPVKYPQSGYLFHGARDYSLKDQIRRAAVSIMANIAEGFARQSNAEFIKFLSYATASAAEVESHLYVALDQGYVDQRAFEGLYSEVTEVSKLINAFMTYLRSHKSKSRR